MARDWNSIMFDDAGVKIQKMAKVLAWIQIVTSIIGGVFMVLGALINLEDLWWMLFLAPVVTAIGCVSAWLSVIVLYGFGELVENSSAPRMPYGRQIAKELSEVNQNVRQMTSLLMAHNAGQVDGGSQTQQTPVKPTPIKPNPVIRNTQDQKSTVSQPSAAPKPQPVAVPKEKTLAEKLAFALQYQTDEGMIAYLSGIQDATVYNILQGPRESIRQRVEALLQRL